MQQLSASHETSIKLRGGGVLSFRWLTAENINTRINAALKSNPA
jgi:hypothetical protein